MKPAVAYAILGAGLLLGWNYFHNAPQSRADARRMPVLSREFSENKGLENSVQLTRKAPARKVIRKEDERNVAQQILGQIKHKIANLTPEEHDRLYKQFLKHEEIYEVDGMMGLRGGDYNDECYNNMTESEKARERKIWAREKEAQFQRYLIEEATDELREQSYVRNMVETAEDYLLDEIIGIQKDKAKRAKQRTEEIYLKSLEDTE